MDSDIERSLMHSGSRVSLSAEQLGFEDYDNEAGPDERALGLRQATLLGGLLWSASATMTDHLFEDLADLDDAYDSGSVTADAVRQTVQQSFILHRLPRRYWHRFDPVFARRLTVAFADLTGRFTQGWREPACVAQELLLRALLDEVEVLVDTYELGEGDLDEAWREVLEDTLLEDDDVDLLYQPHADGVENDEEFLSAVGSAPLAFDQWFVPFNDSRRMPPYAEQEPSGAELT